MASSHTRVMAAQYEAGARAAAQRIMVGKESTILERARTNLALYELKPGEPECARRERIGLHRCPIGHVLLARDAMAVLELRLARMAKERDRAVDHLAHRNEEARADSCSLDEADSNIDRLTAAANMTAHEVRLLRIYVVVLTALGWLIWALSPRTRLGLVPLLISLIRTILGLRLFFSWRIVFRNSPCSPRSSVHSSICVLGPHLGLLLLTRQTAPLPQLTCYARQLSVCLRRYARFTPNTVQTNCSILPLPIA